MKTHPFFLVCLLWTFPTGSRADAGLEAQIEQARSQRLQGLYRTAESTLASLGEKDLPPGLQASAQNELSLVLLRQGRVAEAEAAAKSGLEAARLAGGALEAALHNSLGMAAAASGDARSASRHFAESRLAALAAGDDELAVTAALNEGRNALETFDQDSFERSVAFATETLADSRIANAGHWLALGSLQEAAVSELGMAAQWRLSAFESYRTALSLTGGDERLMSWANGSIGGLYEQENRLQEALQYSSQAALQAMAANADDLLYRWQWQSARILRASGDIPRATDAYRQAISTLGRLRPNLAQGEGYSFRQRAAPVFFEYADLLLLRTHDIADPAEVEANLREVRSTLEQVKVAEVQEYFQDQCVQAVEGSTELDAVSAGVAVIYPILLPGRTELLLSLPGGLRQFTVDVGVARLTLEVREFRRHLERYDFRTDYLRHAQQLHRWLIDPLLPALAAAQVDTLVIVPDGPLRTIPLAALHDGQRFLVEQYALATTPGMTLTSPEPLNRAEVDLFAGGLTESVQGFSALPNVGTELERVSQQFPAETIRDQQFVVDEVQRRISTGEQEIVHIATHGQFDSDHKQSFLLAYDDKITMDRLQSTIATRGRGQDPLELLVLSACQTAAGDDKAALGLAGVALKAGARSALASLWFVNDESTARMIEDFYGHLGNPANSKARALQLAQIALLEDERFSHPAFWAPFLLIGNWL